MNTIIRDLWQDESGATAIEYGLIVGIMAALLVVGLGTFGDKLKDLFAAIATMLVDAANQVSQTRPTP